MELEKLKVTPFAAQRMINTFSIWYDKNSNAIS
jgi:hypothetical protein